MIARVIQIYNIFVSDDNPANSNLSMFIMLRLSWVQLKVHINVASAMASRCVLNDNDLYGSFT